MLTIHTLDSNKDHSVKVKKRVLPVHSLHDIFWGDADIARQLKKKHLFWNGKGKGRIKTMTEAILDCR